MDINSIIAIYLQEKQRAKEASKRADEMKQLIMQHAGQADNFTTDIYTVVIKTTTAARLDTAALYKDFPDIKQVYEKATTSKTVNAVLTAAASKKSA